MNKEQFNSTASVVWAVLKPWLELHFGEKCEEYEFNCEVCERWKLAEELLSFDRSDPDSIEAEIKVLEDCLKWRRELLEKLKPIDWKKLDSSNDNFTDTTVVK